MTRRGPASRDGALMVLVSALAVIGGVSVAGSVLSAALAHALPGGSLPSRAARGLHRLLNTDGEGNEWSWYSSLLLALLALAFLTHALVRRATARPSAPYVALGVVALYLSLDEAAVLHEQLSKLVPHHRSQFQWLYLGVPLAVAAGVVVLWVARGIDATMRRRLLVAGAVFLSGAVLTEAIEAFAVLSAPSKGEALASLGYAVANAVEEGLEVTGVLLALRATLLPLRVRVSGGGDLVVEG